MVSESLIGQEKHEKARKASTRENCPGQVRELAEKWGQKDGRCLESSLQTLSVNSAFSVALFFGHYWEGEAPAELSVSEVSGSLVGHEKHEKARKASTRENCPGQVRELAEKWGQKDGRYLERSLQTLSVNSAFSVALFFGHYWEGEAPAELSVSEVSGSLVGHEKHEKARKGSARENRLGLKKGDRKMVGKKLIRFRSFCPPFFCHFLPLSFEAWTFAHRCFGVGLYRSGWTPLWNRCWRLADLFRILLTADSFTGEHDA